MEDLLIQTLESIIPKVLRQGALLPEEPYPEKFFTYWNDSSEGNGFYNNTETVIVWSYTVCIYSTNPIDVYSLLMEAKTKLKIAGFTVSGGGYDVMSDEQTHTGRGIDVYFRQQI